MSGLTGAAGPAVTAVRPAARSRRRRREQIAGLLYVAPAMVLVALFFVLPLSMTVWMSLNNWPLVGVHRFIGLANYAAILKDVRFWTALRFTALYTGVVTLAIFAVAFPLALFVERPRPLNGFYRTAFFLPVVVGFASASLLWAWLLDVDAGLFSPAAAALGVTDGKFNLLATFDPAFWSIVVMVVWKVAGFTMVIIMTGLQAIPSDLHEAAKLDGAGALARFRLITLPLIRRTLALALILSVAGSVLAFDQFYIILRGGPRNGTLTAVYWIFNQSFVSFKLGYGAALSVVLLVLLVALSLVQLRLLRAPGGGMTELAARRPLTLARRLGLAWPHAIGLAVAALFIAPIAWTVLSTFKPPLEARQPPLPPWPTTGVSLENYARLDGFGAGFWHAALNSTLVSVSSAVLTAAVALLAGYGFSRHRFPLQDLCFVLILATLMVPFQSIVTPIFLILSTLGLQNSLVGLVLVYVTLQLPFSVFMMRNSFDAVPKEIEEAARMDGAGSLQLLGLTLLPLVWPGVVTVGLFAFLNSWNEFFGALVLLTDQRTFTLPLMVAAVQSGRYGAIDWGAVQAGVTAMMIPCLILFLLLQRFYVRGLTAGAVK